MLGLERFAQLLIVTLIRVVVYFLSSAADAPSKDGLAPALDYPDSQIAIIPPRSPLVVEWWIS